MLLLVLTVVVPTIWVLWFMNQAMQNQRLAVRQKLGDVYRGQLASVKKRLESSWRERIKVISGIRSAWSDGRTFHAIVTGDLADSAVIYDSTGRPRYPAPARPPDVTIEDRGVRERAEMLEFHRGDPAAAARAWSRIARASKSIDLAAQALVAEARCLAKTGNKEAAIEILAARVAQTRYLGARDPGGRLIQPDALLRALELMTGPADRRHASTVRLLVERLNAYVAPVLPSGQRRFLMTRVKELVPDAPPFPTLAAEVLAERYLEPRAGNPDVSAMIPITVPSSGESELTRDETPVLLPSRLPRVWRLTLTEGTVVALFTEERIRREIAELAGGTGLLHDVTLDVFAPGSDLDFPASFAAAPAGRPLKGWRLAIRLEDRSLFDDSVNNDAGLYLWMGLLCIVAIVLLAALMAGYLSRQVRLARLKNDLVATVSHELKTPLASIRMLVDTLLEGHPGDAHERREYLEMISKENARLTRLIDSFLTFSRMERNKKTFDFVPGDPAAIARTALAAVRDRFEADGFRLECEIAADLPRIVADSDALVTALLNLLDNAHKYSAEVKHVRLDVVRRGEHVCFEVSDRGIGMTGRAARRVFDRFYQADQRLARRAGGCGLGLSIVKFVVDAHSGSVDVSSRPGQGSTFTVKLPCAGSPAAERIEEGAA